MLINGNCLEEMKNIKDNSVDLIFCDLPYGQTSCKWDCCIDLNLFWKEIMRIKILNAPIIMTTTTKFGVSLIQSAPKKCPFRYDLIWCKSAPCGFLSAKKMPMRKHEMIYVFYEKLPFYDLSSHKHKFIKETVNKRNGKDGVDNKGMIKNRSKTEIQNKYNPPLPTSLIKEEKMNSELYGELPTTDSYGEKIGINKSDRSGKPRYDPPLPTSLIKEDNNVIDGPTYNTKNRKTPITREPPNKYNPPLPTSLVKENEGSNAYGNNTTYNYKDAKKGESIYDPPLPNSLLEIKSTKGKHSTEKPVQLMEWVLKYYSKEGDTVLDPTMGSGSTGVACKNMNRKFIGIEMDKDIYDGAVKRLE
tara:strand:- start:1947 stop:3023 length:1077 start_codon:yes stop_codon:yes gene_type:complete